MEGEKEAKRKRSSILGRGAQKKRSRIEKIRETKLQKAEMIPERNMTDPMDEMFRQRKQEMKERMESLKQREQAVSRREETLKCMREDKRRQEIYVDRGDKAEVSIQVRQEKITPLSQDRAVQFDSVIRDTKTCI